MNFGRQKYTVTFVVTGLSLFSPAVFAVLFEAGAGLGLEYTDNARLSNENKVDDVITTAYVGANLSEDEGALTYDATASSNNTSYVQDTFEDQRYFNLAASADWEMIRERFNWFLNESFRQRGISVLGSSTPDNRQNSNAFTFGANLRYPITARQNFSLMPMFNHYYYEVQATDNKQYSLAANWDYQMFRLTTVGLSYNVRKIDYTEENILGQSIEDVMFTTMAFTLNRQGLRSVVTANIGVTNVERDNSDETTGFVGSLNWIKNLSSRSTFETLLSTNITDTSRVAFNSVDDPFNGSGDDVQITTDVIRNSVFNLAYLREDALLNTRIAARYHKVDYNEELLDRVVRSFEAQLAYPVTQLLTSGVYANYKRTAQLDIDRLDKQFTVGFDLKYNFSQKLHGSFDLRSSTKESTVSSQNYDEYSVFVSLAYGFGNVGRY